MPKNLIDFDPTSGMRTYHVHEDGKNHLIYEQDNVEPLMDVAHEVRARGGIEHDGMRYLTNLPNTVVLELMTKHHINILQKMTPTDEARFERLMDTEYARFKMTDKRIHIAR